MATSDKQYLTVVYKDLDDALTRQVKALARDFNKPRFMQNCMTVMQDGQADFSKCDSATVVRTLLKGAFLGLDFFNGECYAIPYGNQCNFQTDYKEKSSSANDTQRILLRTSTQRLLKREMSLRKKSTMVGRR